MAKKGFDEDGFKWEGPVFTAEVIEREGNGWGSIVVGVFQQDEQDGEKKLLGNFKRNYSTNYNNFSWCRKGDRFFASCIRPIILQLGSMEITPGIGFQDIGGEEKSIAMGFVL